MPVFRALAYNVCLYAIVFFGFFGHRDFIYFQFSSSFLQFGRIPSSRRPLITTKTYNQPQSLREPQRPREPALYQGTASAVPKEWGSDRASM